MTAHDLRDLFRTQHGFALRYQARALGFDHRWVKRRIARGDLEADGPELLRSTSAPITRHGRLVAALLETGEDSALAFSTAAAFWGLPGFRLEPITVVRPIGRSLRDGRYAHVHGTRFLPPHHVIERSGLRITTPTRTLFDLAMVVSAGRLERAMDTAWSLRVTDGPRLERVLEEIRRSGRDGIATMSELIEQRGPGWAPPESGIERRFHSLLREHGQPPMRIQVAVGDDELIGRVDAVDDEAKVIVEIQSDRFHRSPSDVDADARRHARLRAAGWEVVEVWEHEVFHDPAEMLGRLWRLRSARRRRTA